ncbi:MAG: hypothetical protein HDS66_00285 [Bacteroidales bacterium]|nr:hypothetical protein [Bacteroidales bacterium]
MNSLRRIASSATALSSDRALIMAAAGSWMFVAMAALIITGASQMTAPPEALELALQCIGSSAVVIIAGLLICRLSLRRVWSKGLLAVFALLATLMCVGVTINIQGWCEGTGVWAPRFPDYSDSDIIWRSTLAHYGAGYFPWPHNTGYPLILTTLFRVFGGGALTAALASAMCILLSTAATAATCVRLFPAHSPRKVAIAGAALFAVIPSMVWYGTLIMKEAPAILGFALCTYTLATAAKGRLTTGSILTGAGGAALLMLVKCPLGWLLLIGVVLITIKTFIGLLRKGALRHGSLGSLNGMLYLLLLCGAIIVGGRNFRFTTDTELLNARTSTAYAPDADKHVESTEQVMLGYESVKNYSKILGDYYTTPLLSRVMRLPLTASAQYFPPFPWNFNRDKDLSHFVPWAHLPLWYPVGGLVLGYFVLCLWRRKTRGDLGTWSLWVLICWCGIALASAGSVARYWLPIVPAMIPLAVQALVCMRSGTVSRRVIISYCSAYAVLLVVALILAYHLLY